MSFSRPWAPLTPEKARAAFREQAEILADGGVDSFMIQTFIRCRKSMAVQAVREVSDLPILASPFFGSLARGGKTFMGHGIDEAYDAPSAPGHRRLRPQLR